MQAAQSRCGESRCAAWANDFAQWCEAPSWTHFVNPARLATIREFTWAINKRTNASVIYWITPKSAHTTIMNRLLPQSFHIRHIADARMPEDMKRRLLREALKSAPLEFTFVRDPLSHVLAGTRQLQFCLGSEKISLLQILQNVTLDQWNQPACEELHVYPQISGYEMDERGVNRLHFVGRMERLRRDWKRLLIRLGETRRTLSVPVVNRRPRLYNIEEDVFLAHPLVRAHTEWDTRCFQPS